MAVIEPAYTAWYPNGQVIWSTDLGPTTDWTASAGTPLSDTGSGFPWQAPATAQTVRITATNGGVVLIRDVVITDQDFLHVPSLIVEGAIDDVTLFHRMESGARRGRRKIPPKETFEFKFNNRDMDEYQDALDLFDVVGKIEPFIMNDPLSDSLKAWYFDSAITRRFGGRVTCTVDYSFRVVEA